MYSSNDDGFECPNCHGKNTLRSTYVDWCKDCGWEEGISQINPNWQDYYPTKSNANI
jgi:ribosomal protein L37AE/L43A